ncbi:MAG: hypothetical protein H9W80_13105 [Enterococcus sp.]|nr:hypothetical protein [Enterococcus sp.]
MKKAILGFMLLFVIFIVTGCGSSGPDKNQMKAAIQVAAEDKGYEGAKWPFFEEDWHFEKTDDGNYTSYGTFKSGGKKHEFSAEVDPESDVLLDFYVN